MPRVKNWDDLLDDDSDFIAPKTEPIRRDPSPRSNRKETLQRAENMRNYSLRKFVDFD